MHTEVEIEGRRLALGNLDKVLYPSTGTTKAAVIDYYRRVAPALLPHLAGRPPTLVRAPDGVDGPRFFEKRCPGHRPEWMRTAPITDYEGCCIDELAGLIWLANLAAIELHTHQWRSGAPTCDALVIDLDPGPGCDLFDCRRAALELRAVLERLSLVALVKTSGSKGLHLSVPLNGAGAPHEHTKQVALALGQYLETKFPERATTNMAKEQRPGRVFVDWSQNDRHKTTVAPYSLRLRDRPTVSTPLTWDELVEAHDVASLAFEIDDVAARVERHGDLWTDRLTLVQQLPDLGRS
jgi:bifunctional non-homologous end joining protein LigD